MAGVEEEPVACYPLRLVRVVCHVFREEDGGEVGAAHGASGMSGFGFLHHGGYQDPKVVGSLGVAGVIHYLVYFDLKLVPVDSAYKIINFI